MEELLKIPLDSRNVSDTSTILKMKYMQYLCFLGFEMNKTVLRFLQNCAVRKNLRWIVFKLFFLPKIV